MLSLRPINSTILLCALLSGQNSTLSPQVKNNLLRLDSLVGSMGMISFLFCYLLIFEGLQHSPEEEDVRFNPARRSSLDESNGGFSSSSISYSIPMGSSAHDKTMRKKYLALHHPCSSFSGDFYVGKFFKLSLSGLILVIIRQLLLGTHRSPQIPIFRAILGSSCTTLLLAVYWTWLVIEVCLSFNCLNQHLPVET